MRSFHPVQATAQRSNPSKRNHHHQRHPLLQVSTHSILARTPQWSEEPAAHFLQKSRQPCLLQLPSRAPKQKGSRCRIATNAPIPQVCLKVAPAQEHQKSPHHLRAFWRANQLARPRSCAEPSPINPELLSPARALPLSQQTAAP